MSLPLGILTLSATLFAQIDTRVSPVPYPPEQTNTAMQSKWTGPRVRGFLSEQLGSNLKQGLNASLGFSETFRNQSASAMNDSGVDEVAAFTGTASAQHEWSKAFVFMQYAGGNSISAHDLEGLNGQFHQFTANEELQLSRWNISLTQQYDYLPQSSFGFDPAHAIGGGATENGQIFPGLDFFLPPSVIERTMITQASTGYGLTPHSGLSLSGTFSDLHFSGVSRGSSLADSQRVGAGGGYWFALDAQDTFGARYNFSQGRTTALNGVVQTHSVIGSYTRTIGHHLTLQAGSGPQFTTAQFGNIQVNLGVSSVITANANYQFGRSNLGASYFRGVNAGSGLFLGSHDNNLRASFDHRFGNNLQGSVAAGYGRNQNLELPPIIAAQLTESAYVTVTAERNIGRMMSAFVSYSLQRQNASSGLCILAGCSQFPNEHFGMIGLRFHIHPLTLRP